MTAMPITRHRVIDKSSLFGWICGFVSDFVFRFRVFRRCFNPVFLPQDTPRPARSGHRQRDTAVVRQQDRLEVGPQAD